MKIICINGMQYNRLFEGIEYSNRDGVIDLHINHDTTDAKNLGKNSVDTRVFGTRNDILNGDGTLGSRNQTLAMKVKSKASTVKFYKSLIDKIDGKTNELYVDEFLPLKSKNTVKRWYDAGKSDEEIKDLAKQKILKNQDEASLTQNKVDRLMNDAPSGGSVTERYDVGTVQGTNVKFIALFSMKDFNFSDAIKHGALRQNGNTDAILGIKEKDRAKNGKSYQKLGMTYDGKYTPNIARNFSLDNVGVNGHYKQQFGLNGEGGYTSVNQFLDKSVNYAAHVLRKQGFKPSVIVACPSSSKFNDYYCTNLSNKIGVPYFRDFFNRNLVNVKFDGGKDVSDMKNDGFTDAEIIKFQSKVKSAVFAEIAHIISEPIASFINTNQGIFSSISIAKGSREKVSLDNVIDCVMNYAYQTVISTMEGNVSESEMGNKYLINLFMQAHNTFKRNAYDPTRVQSEIVKLIKLKVGIKTFNSLLQKTYQLVKKYSDILQTNGYSLNFDTKSFKITKFEKRERPYLHNVYVVADKYLNENGEMFSRYKNANFLIFDEDINSGGTFKLVIEALKAKAAVGDDGILCLANAYSSSGF